MSQQQEMEADVVVVGYGGAGATAGITAHDRGASVLILEKQSSGGGNTLVSGGTFFVPKSVEAIPFAVKYVEALSCGATEREIIQTFVDRAVEIKDWIQELGGEAVPVPPYSKVFYPRPPEKGPTYPNVNGAEHTTKLCVKGNLTEPMAQRLWKFLSSNVERRGIPVLTGTVAKELVTDADGAVTGVVAERAGEKVLIKARRAVVLACGGFEYNDAMKEAFLLCKPFYAAGNPGNTGDGIVMAQKVGAALWHMKSVEGYLGFKPPEYQAAFPICYWGAGFIHVNRQGNRFCDETAREYHDRWRDVAEVDSREITTQPGFPNIPAYGIFDEVTRCKGPLYRQTNPSGYNRGYKWSPDNSQEIANGWIIKADTIGELARRLSIDESSLENTVARYNGHCKLGKDADFGRSKDSLEPIETPPFYAIEFGPCLLNTQGGPRRDKAARVLDHDGKPIRRLYAAGELGSIWGFLYNSGGNIAECLAFGRIAGENAAMEKQAQ